MPLLVSELRGASGCAPDSNFGALASLERLQGHTRALQSLPGERQERCQSLGLEGMGSSRVRSLAKSFFESNRYLKGTESFPRAPELARVPMGVQNQPSTPGIWRFFPLAGYQPRGIRRPSLKPRAERSCPRQDIQRRKKMRMASSVPIRRRKKRAEALGRPHLASRTGSLSQ